jgi:hypothetical protein
MAGFYDGRAERERRERDTPEKILAIMKRKKRFDVSLRYRDSWLRDRLTKMKKDGLVRGGSRDGDCLVFYLPKEA